MTLLRNIKEEQYPRVSNRAQLFNNIVISDDNGAIFSNNIAARVNHATCKQNWHGKLALVANKHGLCFLYTNRVVCQTAGI